MAGKIIENCGIAACMWKNRIQKYRAKNGF